MKSHQLILFCGTLFFCSWEEFRCQRCALPRSRSRPVGSSQSRDSSEESGMHVLRKPFLQFEHIPRFLVADAGDRATKQADPVESGCENTRKSGVTSAVHGYPSPTMYRIWTCCSKMWEPPKRVSSSGGIQPSFRLFDHPALQR